jgi:hypothetical protein
MKFDWVRLPVRQDSDEAALLHIDLCCILREERNTDSRQGELMVDSRVWNGDAGLHPDLLRIGTPAQTPDCRICRFS